MFRVYPGMGRERHNLRPLRTYRRDLRANATPAEVALWQNLRRRQLGGWRFRRQYSVGHYVLDFFCPAARLAVELDGAGHAEPGQAAYDAERTAWLAETEGIRVLRFWNHEVGRQLDGVLARIADELARPTELARPDEAAAPTRRCPPPSASGPSPTGGG